MEKGEQPFFLFYLLYDYIVVGESGGNDMFVGKYEHTLDNKNRLTLPAKLRNKLGTIVYLSRGLETNLEVRTIEEFGVWEAELEQLEAFKKETRTIKRYIFANSAEIEIDNAGRIQIPQSLLAAAHLQKNVVVLGVGEKVEIWDHDLYQRYERENFSKIAEMADKINTMEN